MIFLGFTKYGKELNQANHSLVNSTYDAFQERQANFTNADLSLHIWEGKELD